MWRILSNRLEWEAQVCVGAERKAGGVAGPHLPQLASRTCMLQVYFHWEMRLLSRGPLHRPPSICTLARSCLGPHGSIL